MNESLRNQIITEIKLAFDQVPRGAITLHETVVIDNYGSDRERATARRLDVEKRWQDVPAKAIAEHPSALSFLCPESFRYYIPAFMVWSLRHCGENDSPSSDFTIYALTPNTNKARDRWKLERFVLFSSAQAKAVQRFLRFMVDHTDGHADAGQAELALSAYWNAAAAA